MSFVGSRLNSPDLCTTYAPKPFHFYLLFGTNVSSQISAIFQASVSYGNPVLWYSTDGITFLTSSAETNYFQLIAPFTTRYLYYAFLDNLTPGTTYYVKAGDLSNPNSQSPVLKFRTGPMYNEPYEFAVGGDVGCEFPYPEMTSQQVATREILFLALGGDVAYANGLPGCYQRWDKLLWMWERTLITPNNYTIPFIFAIGNHEAGVAWGSYSKATAPYYFNYLPWEAVNGRNPEELDSFHYHVIGNSTVLYSLDSEITLSAPAQVGWLTSLMGGAHANLPNKLAIYHVPMYPGSRAPTDDPIPYLRESWLSVFDQYHLKIAFENHDHVFLHSLNMYNNQPNATGTLYMGDGAFGVVGTLATDDATRNYIVKTEAIRHFMFVQVNNTLFNITVVGYDGSYLDNVLQTRKK